MRETFQTIARTLLAADGELRELVGDRIRPDKLAETDGVPAIITELETNQAYDDLGTVSTGEGQGILAVHCVAHTRGEATDVESAARAILDGHFGAVGAFADVRIKYLETAYEHDPPEDDGDEADWFRNVARFYVFARRG